MSKFKIGILLNIQNDIKKSFYFDEDFDLFFHR